MPSATYELFLAAMRGRRQIVCLYQGHRRELCPILLGRTGLEEKCLAYQFGGDTSAGRLPAAGEWKCLKLRDVRDAVLRDGPWRQSRQSVPPGLQALAARRAGTPPNRPKSLEIWPKNAISLGYPSPMI